ncbi:MAG TPA: pitrilysin family protein [Thermoanaerobaculia bacterium]|nr:pitrilysin family protein [Thermoanaerobaculia bacterium]
MSAEITTKTLKNGMKILVWPDHDIPNVAMYTWYHVGSRNETYGITGLSHFFEHMMFNGAKKYGPGEFDRVMEANGGANNAYTSENVTVYQDWFPSSALELIFDLEADRIQHLAFDPKIIESERGVVYSERRSSVDNNNSGLLSEQVQSTAFVAHPYHTPVIGWPSDIESWTHEDLVKYFKTYYAPNNATMLVVGDVTPAQVFALAEKYIEPIPSNTPPEPVRTKEPQQMGERRVTIRKLAETPQMQVAYHVGNASDPDGEAIDLLLSILTDGDSSRLHRRLVEQDPQAIDVHSYRDRGFDPSLAWFLVTLTGDGDLAKTEKMLDEELARIAKEGPTAAELSKARNMAVANFWRSLSTINGKAQTLGTYEVFYGDYKLLFQAPAKYEAVTADQIKSVAQKYFLPTNRTVGWLVPEAEEQPKKASGK